MTPHLRRKAEGADRALGEAIRARRETLGMTQQQLAEAAAVSYQQLQKYESGLNRVSFSRLVKISYALRLTVADLTRVLDGGDAAAVAIEHDRFRYLPEAEKLLRLYAALPPAGRAGLLQLLNNMPGLIDGADAAAEAAVGPGITVAAER